MTGILMAMVAKKNKNCFYKSDINDGCDILVTIYKHYTIFTNLFSFLKGDPNCIIENGDPYAI